MSRYDHIEEVDTQVKKFNPFHDNRGRFSSSNGFASYSANPNTKAGAMAISRSAAAGHGNTLNVHRQSYGENIRQNANWIGRGHQASPRQQGNATLRSRIEPKSGLRGASAAGAQWQSQNQAAGRTTGGKKPPQQQKPAQTNPQAQKPTTQQQKPTQTKPKSPGGNLAQDTANVTVSSKNKLGITPKNGNGQTVKTNKVADDNYQKRVSGKDISKSFDSTKIAGNKNAVDKAAEAQGWNKGSTVTNDMNLFQKAAVKSGVVMFRSVNGNGVETPDQVCKKTMSDGNYSLGGSGGKAYGGGLYLTHCKLTADTSTAKRVASSSDESYFYGRKQMMATLHPNAKIATEKQSDAMRKDFVKKPVSEKAKFGNDWGAYIASKGYDGAIWHNADDPTGYMTMYNKSAIIFYGGASDI